jgi:RimJ/RimL family protein N-acetyltransferase
VVAIDRPTPPLSDDTVTLRELAIADVPAVTAACADPEIVRWTAEIPEDYKEEHARAWIESTREGWAKGNAEFAISEAESDTLAGVIGLFRRADWIAEIGYWIGAPFRGRGYATRALTLVTDWGFSLGFVRVQLLILPGNDASARVASKAGFIEEGLLHGYLNQRGSIRDASMWSRVRE